MPHCLPTIAITLTMKTPVTLPYIMVLSLTGPAYLLLLGLINGLLGPLNKMAFSSNGLLVLLYCMLASIPLGVGISLSLWLTGSPIFISTKRLLRSGVIGGALFGMFVLGGVIGPPFASLVLSASLGMGIKTIKGGLTVWLGGTTGVLLGLLVVGMVMRVLMPLYVLDGVDDLPFLRIMDFISVPLPLFGLNLGALLALRWQTMRAAPS